MRAVAGARGTGSSPRRARSGGRGRLRHRRRWTGPAWGTRSCGCPARSGRGRSSRSRPRWTRLADRARAQRWEIRARGAGVLREGDARLSRHREDQRVQMGSAISANPLIRFPLKITRSGTVRSRVREQRGPALGGLPARPDLASRRATQELLAQRDGAQRGQAVDLPAVEAEAPPAPRRCAVQERRGPREAREACRRRGPGSPPCGRCRNPAAPSLRDHAQDGGPGDPRTPRRTQIGWPAAFCAFSGARHSVDGPARQHRFHRAFVSA